MPKNKKVKKEPKIKRLMKEQSKDDRIKASFDIEDILTNVVNKQVKDYFNKFGATIERKLGLTQDDIQNDMREQVWKGLLTHNGKSGKANLKTYINKIIKNRFLLLYNRSTLGKYNCVDYCTDPYGLTNIQSEAVETKETGESLLEKRQELMAGLEALSSQDTRIFNDLMLGFDINQMMKRSKLCRTDVVGAINRINRIIKEKNQEDIDER